MGYRRRGLVAKVALVAGLIVWTACQDSPTSSDREAESVSGVVAAAGSRAGPKRVKFYCSTSELQRNGQYKFKMVKLRLGAQLYAAAEGRTVPFHYTEYGSDGRVAQIVHCDVPAVFAAGKLVMLYFNVQGQQVTTSQYAQRAIPDLGRLVFARSNDPLEEPEECNPWDPDNNSDPGCAIDLPGIIVTPPPDEPPPDDDPPPPPPPPPPGPGSDYGGDGDPDDGNSPQPAFSLTCPNPIRGTSAYCRVEASEPVVFTVGWAFNGGGKVNSSNSGATTWGGPWVATGGMRAYVYHEGSAETLSKQVAVQPRQMKWSSSNYSYAAGAGPDNPGRDGVPRTTADVVSMGWVCNRDLGCPMDSQRMTHPTGSGGSGVSHYEIPSGPNEGLHYVTAAHYSMRLGSQVNPEILPTADKWAVTDPADESWCAGKVGYNSSYQPMVNFFTYNRVCRGTSEFDDLVQGVTAHEDDHGARATGAAQVAGNDPWSRVEGIVRVHLDDFQDVVALELTGVNDRLHAATMVTHNYTWWEGAQRDWNPDQKRFVDVTGLIRRY